MLLYDVYDRLRELTAGQVVYVDYGDTLWDSVGQMPNIQLISALKEAKRRGILVHLWTHEGFAEAVKRVEVMEGYGLIFDDVHCGVPKANLIIDNLSVPPL
jgi:hypothetical protein